MDRDEDVGQEHRAGPRTPRKARARALWYRVRSGPIATPLRRHVRRAVSGRCLDSGHPGQGVPRHTGHWSGVASGAEVINGGSLPGCRRPGWSSPPSPLRSARSAKSRGPTASPGRGSASCWPATGLAPGTAPPRRRAGPSARLTVEMTIRPYRWPDTLITRAIRAPSMKWSPLQSGINERTSP